MSYTYADKDIDVSSCQVSYRVSRASTQAIFRIKAQCYRDRCVSYTYTDTGIDNVRHICWHR